MDAALHANQVLPNLDTLPGAMLATHTPDAGTHDSFTSPFSQNASTLQVDRARRAGEERSLRPGSSSDLTLLGLTISILAISIFFNAGGPFSAVSTLTASRIC